MGTQDSATATNPHSVTNFGAKGDGTTDDTQSIQEAVNAGGDIFFPAGVYLISETIELVSNVKFYTEPKTSVVLKFCGQTFIGFHGQNVVNIIFENLTLANYAQAQGIKQSILQDSTSKSVTAYPVYTTDQMLSFGKSQNIQLINCRFNWKNGVGWLPTKADAISAYPKGLYGGLRFAQCSDINIDGCTFQNSARITTMPPGKEPCHSLFFKNNLLQCVEIENSGQQNVIIQNCKVENIITAFRIMNSNNTKIINNTITDTLDTSIFDRSTQKDPTYNRLISNNTFTNIGKSAIKIMDVNTSQGQANNGLVLNNSIENWALHTFSAAILSANHYAQGGEGTQPTAAEKANNLKIYKNTIKETSAQSGGKVFQIFNTLNVMIMDNTVKLMDKGPDNPCGGSNKNEIMQGCEVGRITGNTFNSNQPWYIKDCTNITIDNNTVTPGPISVETSSSS